MVASISSNIAGLGETLQKNKVVSVQPVPKVSFSEVMMGVSKGGGENLHAELVKLSHAIHSGKNISPKELLYYQIRAGQFGLQVELASKLGESLTSTIRKLEQGH